MMITDRRNWLARSVKIALGAAAIVAMTAAAKTAHAQDFPPPPPDGGPGGPGGFGGGRGPMGRGGMRGPGRPASLSTAPIEALTAALNLNETQETKIKALQKTWRETEQSERQNSGIRPPQLNGGNGGPPSDEDREAMRAQFQKFMEQQQAFDKKLEPKRKAAETEMSAVLTDSQKKALPEALKSIDALQQAGIPAELQGSLKLSEAQRTKLATVADKYAPPKPGERTQQGQGGPGGPGGFGPGGPGGGRRAEARAAVLGVLTDAQKKTVTDWEKAHPRPERGPGGFGGPGGPGGGFPPPPPSE